MVALIIVATAWYRVIHEVQFVASICASIVEQSPWSMRHVLPGGQSKTDSTGVPKNKVTADTDVLHRPSAAFWVAANREW